MKLTYVLIFFLVIPSVSSSLGCAGDYDDKEEFQRLSGGVLISYLEDPRNAKLSSLEITQLSAFYEKYQDDWENADCNEKGISGKSINEIMLKSEGGIFNSWAYPFIGIVAIVLLVGFVVYRQFIKKE